MYLHAYIYVCVCLHMRLNNFLQYLQDTGVASAQPSSILLENTGPYAVPSLTADKDQMVNVCMYNSNHT